MSGFTPINEIAFMELIECLPEHHRLAARSICLDMLFHARRNPGTAGGVQLERGQILYSLRGISERCYVSFQTTRTIIFWLKKVQFLTHESTHSKSIASIVEFDRYVSDRRKTNTETNNQLTQYQRTKGTKGKDKSICTLENPAEAQQALQCWTDLAALPKSANEEKCLKALDDLHRLDQVPWDGATGIFAICEYAAREWVPEGYIGSPVALRGWTRSRDMKKYEAVQQQMAVRRSQTPSKDRSKPTGYLIVFPDGTPVTEFTKRLRRIVNNGEETDPDRGHDWTIADDVIAQAKEKGVESFLRDHTEGAPYAKENPDPNSG